MNTSCGVPEVDIFQFRAIIEHQRHVKPKASGESYSFS